jgi:hypothetical protein
MGRSRAAAKAAGSRMERVVADHLARYVDDRIDRRVKTGAADKGDIASLRVHGQRVVVEVKDTAKMNIGPHLREAETERVNDGALAGLVVQKRTGIGVSTPEGVGQQLVTMTLDDLIAILIGTRPDHAEPAD